MIDAPNSGGYPIVKALKCLPPAGLYSISAACSFGNVEIHLANSKHFGGRPRPNVELTDRWRQQRQPDGIQGTGVQMTAGFFKRKVPTNSIFLLRFHPEIKN